MLKLYYILIPLILLMVFFLPNITNAEDLISIDNTNCTWYTQGQNFNNGYSSSFFRQSFTAVNNNISKIVLKKGTNYVYLESTRQVGLAIYKLSTNEVVMATSTIIYEDGVRGSEFTWQLPLPIPLTIGEVYYFAWEQSGSCNAPDYSCFNLVTTLDNNGCYTEGAYSYGTIRDIYFKIYYDNNVGSQDIVEPEYPPPFTWQLDSDITFTGTYNSTGNYDNIKIEILKYASSSTATWYSDTFASSTIGNNNTFSIDINLPAGTYAWTPYLYSADTQNETNGKAVTIYWNFSVHYPNGNPVPIIIDNNLKDGQVAADESVLVLCDMVSTSTPSGVYGWLARWITEGSRDLICTFFVPKRSYLDDLASSTNQLKTKAPIGYITSISNLLTQIATSSEATTAPAFLTEEQYNILHDISDFGLFNLIKTILSYLFLLIAIVYTYGRIKHFIKI